MVEGAYPPPFYPDPLLSNVNFRPMPDDPHYFRGRPDSYTDKASYFYEIPRPGSSHVMAETREPEAQEQQESPEQEQQEKQPALTPPTDLTYEVLDNGRVKLSASVPPGQSVSKLVFYVDNKQAGVVTDTEGVASVVVVMESGEHKVRAFTYTGTDSGPWSETVSVTV